MKGSCLCGQVEYEVMSLDLPIQYCHCRTCQKAHAAPFAVTAGVMEEHFRWTRGEDVLRGFASSPDKIRYFCGQCGTHLMARRQGKPHVVLRIATLDDVPDARPEAHIWMSHHAEWLEAGDIPQYSTWRE